MIDPVRAAQPISHQARLQPKSPGARLRLLHRRHLHRRRSERSCPAKSICGPLAAHAYNYRIPQRALDHRSPIQALQKWQSDKPAKFKKRVINQPGLDI